MDTIDDNASIGNDFVAIAAGLDYSLALTPEPATLLLFGLGGLMLSKRRTGRAGRTLIFY